jgi:hypothetical protein
MKYYVAGMKQKAKPDDGNITNLLAGQRDHVLDPKPKDILEINANLALLFCQITCLIMSNLADVLF